MRFIILSLALCAALANTAFTSTLDALYEWSRVQTLRGIDHPAATNAGPAAAGAPDLPAREQGARLNP